MGVRAAVATGLLIVAAAAVSFRGVYEPDLWDHLAQGREVLSGHIVRTNVFSFPDYRQRYTLGLFDRGAQAAWRFGGGAAIWGFPARERAALHAARSRAAPSMGRTISRSPG